MFPGVSKHLSWDFHAVLMGLKTNLGSSLKGNSLAVQWLGLGAFTAGAQGSIPGWGTKIPDVAQHSQTEGKKKLPEAWNSAAFTVYYQLLHSAWDMYQMNDSIHLR